MLSFVDICIFSTCGELLENANLRFLNLRCFYNDISMEELSTKLCGVGDQMDDVGKMVIIRDPEFGFSEFKMFL